MLNRIKPAIIIVFIFITIIHAQINLQSNAINFRTTSDYAQKTMHYGNMEVRGDGTGSGPSVLYIRNESSAAATRYAIYGQSILADGYGIGGYFLGSWRGVTGTVNSNGNSSDRTGGYFSAGGTGTATKFGVYAIVTGNGTKWSGYFTGASIYVNGTTFPSDQRFKTGNQPIPDALNTILQLKPEQYYYDTTTYKSMGFSSKKQFGLIAQDVETVIPDIVKDVPMPKPSENAPSTGTFKGIDYVSLVPILIAAIQEQQKEIDDLKSMLKK
jgi:hypothetical protein